MTEPWMPPENFSEMRQVAVVPVSPDWLESHGVPMQEAEVEPGWPLLHGTVQTDVGAVVMIGAAGDDAVGLWAHQDVTPQQAVDGLEAVLQHGTTPTVFDESTPST